MARSPSGGGGGVAGRTTEIPFARFVASLALRRMTGVLRLEQDGRKYALYFQEGAIADADSAAPEDTLGRIALEDKLIDSQMVSDSLRRMAQDRNKSQKDILVEMGALMGDGLERALRLTLTRRAMRIFALPGATFFVEDVDHGRLEGGLVEPRWSLYRGLRAHYDERRLDLEMASGLTGQAIKLTVDPAAIYEAFGFSNEERIVLAYLHRVHYWELADLVDACMTVPRVIVLAVVHALHAFEYLDVKPRASVNRYRKAAREQTQELNRQTLELELKGPPTNPPGLTPQGVRFTPPTGAPISLVSKPRVSEAAPTEPNPPVDSSARPRATGTNPPVPPFTSPERSAGQSPLPTGRPGSPSGPSRPQQISIPSTPVTTTRGSGPSQPTQPTTGSTSAPGTRRTGPTAPFGGNQRIGTLPGQGAVGTRPPAITPSGGLMPALKEQQIAFKLAAVERDADYFTLLEVERTATSDQIQKSYIALARLYHPDRISSDDVLRPQADKIFKRLNEAYSAISDDTRRKEYLAVLAQGGAAAVKRRANEEAELVTKALTADEHYKKGEMAIRRQMFAAAVEEFQAAIELNATWAEYHAMLAWAKWCNAADKQAIFQEVRTGFQTAVRLNSRCIPAFYYRGQMFNALGDNEKAYKSFQQVLSIDADHVDASREVRLMEMRKKTGQKGLFDRFRKK